MKHFCDWCGTELVDSEDWKDNPFDTNGEICRFCFDLMERAFSGKHIVKVTTLDFGGVTYEHVRIEAP